MIQEDLEASSNCDVITALRFPIGWFVLYCLSGTIRRGPLQVHKSCRFWSFVFFPLLCGLELRELRLQWVCRWTRGQHREEQSSSDHRVQRLSSGVAMKLSVFSAAAFFFFICIYLLIRSCIYLFVCCRSEEDSEGNRDICSEILQMKALERLTSTVSRHSENFFFF